MAHEGGDTMGVLWRVEDNAERVLGQRRAFRDCLDSIAVPAASDVDGAELIYGELVGNAMRHAHGAVEARLELADTDAPVLVVRDHGPGMHVYPWPPHRDPYAESGRGLAIVELLARKTGVEEAEGGGTIVRATLPVTARDGASDDVTSC